MADTGFVISEIASHRISRIKVIKVSISSFSFDEKLKMVSAGSPYSIRDTLGERLSFVLSNKSDINSISALHSF